MTPKTAVNILLCRLAIAIVFHLCILFKITPYEITWGGRLKNDQEMYVFEAISIVVNLFLGVILLIKGSYIKPIISIKIVNIILWGFIILFGLNTIGNIFAATNFEKYFSVVTLANAVLLWIVLKKNNNQYHSNNLN